MNDLISREWCLTEYDKRHKGLPGNARKIIEEAPTVDAVPVVRCKDCRYYDHKEGTGWCDLNSFMYISGIDWNGFDDDDFCSKGEMREDE